MSAPSVFRVTTATVTGQESIAGKIARRLRSVRRWHRQRCAVRDLRGLSNHTLRDIGLHRSEVTSLIYDTRAERRRCYAEH